MSRHDLILEGCAPEPLAHYLKAVAIHRLVAEQVDPDASSRWVGDQFVLRSTLDADGLRAFFLEQWVPTPVLSPWNGGSGFHPGDNVSGISPIEASHKPRFAAWQQAIGVARRCLAELGLTAKPEKEAKPLLIELLRAELPDGALAWLDAAIHLTADGVKFPPLLGTGGNDGRLDFSNNFMQQVWGLLGDEADSRQVKAALEGALTGVATRRMSDASVGQFFPAAAGGLNAGPGFESGARVNPWDYVWMVEGALMFAAASSRKLDAADPGVMVFPFAVRASGAGYASGADADEGESRDEMWMPLWGRWSTMRELRALIGEARCTVRGAGGLTRPAHSAVDFARALGQLGVDRGVTAFTRYGFHVRNGLAYQAVPLGRWQRRGSQRVDLLSEIDDWLRGFRRAAADERAPAELGRLRRRLDQAMLALCQGGDVEGVLVTLGEIDGALGRRRAWCVEKGVAPVPWLSPDWARQLPASVGHHLAGALAARVVGEEGALLRQRFSPVGVAERPYWCKPEDDRTCWGGASLEANLGQLLLREQAEGGTLRPTEAAVGSAEITAFIAGAVDDRQIEALARGLALVRSLPPITPWSTSAASSPPPTLYRLLALAGHAAGVEPPQQARRAAGVDDPQQARRAPGMLRRALVGDASGASAAALRRLRGDGRPAALVAGFALSPALTRRCAAALAFPIHRAALENLVQPILCLQEPAS